MKRFGIATAVLFILFFALLVSQSNSKEAQREDFKVKLKIGGEESMWAELNSYLSRELRSLNDVTIVDDDADYEIHIMALQDTAKTGQTIGYTLSVVILRPLEVDFLKWLMDQCYEIKPRENPEFDFDSEVSNLYSLRLHLVMGGGNNDLRMLCNKIVAEFDSGQLEPKR